MELISRKIDFPDDNILLLGPRGTGKSTCIAQEYPDAYYIDLLDPKQYRLYAARPERIIDVVKGNPEMDQYVIDEIQRIPELLPVVHLLIEKYKHKRFILTGSSARKLRRSGNDLLAGRAVRKYMHQFTASELGKMYDFNAALKYGTVPLIWTASGRSDKLNSYIDLYLREEVQAEGLTRNIGNFTRFLEAASFSHSSVLNISNIARECQLERKVVEGYVSILEDLLIAFKLPVFEKKAKRKTIKHSKFYYFDSGVFRTLRPSGPLDNPTEIDGQALEGLIAAELLALCDNYSHQLYYWRTRSGTEVDFIIYGKKIFSAIEVKNTSVPRKEYIRSLKTFRTDYPQSQPFLLYRGNEKLMIDDVLFVPCEEFLLNIKKYLL